MHHDIQAENKLISSIMLDKYWYEKIEDIELRSEYFYSIINESLYKVIEDLNDKNIVVDLITVVEGIKRLGLKVSMIDLTDIFNTVTTSAGIEHYAEIVKEKYVKRSIVEICSNAINEINTNQVKSKEMLSVLDEKIYNLGNKKESSKFRKNDKIMLETYKEIELRSNSDKKIIGIETGYRTFDKITGGLRGNKLIILAGRPGMGKTTVLLEIIKRASKNESVAFFSMEMKEREICERQICNAGEINHEVIKNGTLKNEDWEKLAKATEEISNYNIYIDDNSTQTLLDIKRKCRRLKRSVGIKVVAIDYLSYMTFPKANTKTEAIEEVTRGLKGIAKELDITIILLAQLNRECEKRPDKKPMLSDLKDSGAIEQDADLVAFVYRPEFYNIRTRLLKGVNSEYPIGYTGLIIAKNRDGQTGTIDMISKLEYYKVEELDKYVGY